MSNDNEMIVNVRDSSSSAYEAEAIDKIGQIFVKGILSSEVERSRFFAEISNDKNILRELASLVIQRIKGGLLAS